MSGLLSAEDRQRIGAFLADARSDNEVEIAIRRVGAAPDFEKVTLAPQRVRIVRSPAQIQIVDGQGVEASLSRVMVLGPVDLDIERGDRFTHGGVVYEVTGIHPTRIVSTRAEAVRIE